MPRPSDPTRPLGYSRANSMMHHNLMSRPPDQARPVRVLPRQLDDASYCNVPPARPDPPVRVLACQLDDASYLNVPPARPDSPVTVRPTDRPDSPVRVPACQLDDASYFNVPPARPDPPVRVRPSDRPDPPPVLVAGIPAPSAAPGRRRKSTPWDSFGYFFFVLAPTSSFGCWNVSSECSART